MYRCPWVATKSNNQSTQPTNQPRSLSLEPTKQPPSPTDMDSNRLPSDIEDFVQSRHEGQTFQLHPTPKPRAIGGWALFRRIKPFLVGGVPPLLGSQISFEAQVSWIVKANTSFEKPQGALEYQSRQNIYALPLLMSESLSYAH